jgi:hypothetical protein
VPRLSKDPPVSTAKPGPRCSCYVKPSPGNIGQGHDARYAHWARPAPGVRRERSW